MLDDLQPVEKRANAIFGKTDAIDLTEEVIVQLARIGWEEERVGDAARHGAKYSPSRGTLLFPTMGSL